LAANALSYNPDLRRLEYLGQVKGRQNGRTLEAQELILELNQERQPERYLAQGEVVLREPERQLEIQAERGEHFPSTGLARFGGQRVLLREPRGVVEGKALEYNLKTGIARWLGGQRP
jgi:lipopolysaccharide export system protein LptA